VDAVVQQGVLRVGDRHVWGKRDDVSGHDLTRFHRVTTFQLLDSAVRPLTD
jgi:hypothetical protein